MIKYLFITLACTLQMLSMNGQTGRGDKPENNLQQQKVAFFNEKLQLTTAESAKFWPVYNDYQNRRDKITKDRNTLIQYFESNKANMKEAEANEMITKYVGFQQEETKLMETFTAKFKEILPAQKVMRIFSVEIEFKKWLLENLRQNKVKPVTGK